MNFFNTVGEHQRRLWEQGPYKISSPTRNKRSTAFSNLARMILKIRPNIVRNTAMVAGATAGATTLGAIVVDEVSKPTNHTREKRFIQAVASPIVAALTGFVAGKLQKFKN